MKSRVCDSSYDRNQAKTLAQRLHSRLHDGASSVPLPNSRAPRQAAERSAMSQPAPDLRFDEEGVYRQDVWAALLDWGLQVSGANKAFVADQQGLVIALRGKGEASEMEVAASVFASALGQLKVLCEDRALPRAVLLDTGHQHLSVLAVGPKYQALLVGFASDDPVEHTHYCEIAKIFDSKLCTAPA